MQRVVWSRLTINLEGSEARGKSVVADFEVIFIFIFFCRYLERFYSYNKTNNIFLKFHHSFLSMPKILEIGLIVPADHHS